MLAAERMIIWVVRKYVSVVDEVVRWIAFLPGRLKGCEFGPRAGQSQKHPYKGEEIQA
jgi:hypothetical protein